VRNAPLLTVPLMLFRSGARYVRARLGLSERKAQALAAVELQS